MAEKVKAKVSKETSQVKRNRQCGGYDEDEEPYDDYDLPVAESMVRGNPRETVNPVPWAKKWKSELAAMKATAACSDPTISDGT